MTALPRPPGRPLTIADYADLGEDDQYRWELQEGSLVMSPSPTPRHMIAMGELFLQVRAQLPRALRAVQDIDIDLQLAAADRPGSSRRPDLVVVSADEVERVDREGGLLRASTTALVVEIISPGSERMDQIVKRSEYADAGIPHYWIIDLQPAPALTACHLAGDFGYQDAGAVTGIFTATESFTAQIDLNALA